MNGRFGSIPAFEGPDFDAGECPVLATSRHSEGHARESALPPKADIGGTANLRTQKADIGARFGEGTLLFNSLHRLQGSPYMDFRPSETPGQPGKEATPINRALTGREEQWG